MFLAWRDMIFARTRFLLMGAVLALMSILIVIISGLTAGLVNDGVSGLKAIDGDVIAFADGTQTDSAFTRSVVDTADAETLADAPGVETATPMGLTIANAHNQDGIAVDLTLIGVEAGSFLAPENINTAPEIVVSNTLADEGIELGDTITIDRIGTELTVIGFTEEQHTFGHVPLAYMPLEVWQEISGRKATEASVIVAQTTSAPDTAELSAQTGLDVRTLEASFDSSPGYTAETMTLSMIEWFLYVIAALVTGAFFLVWTIQRAGDIATLRAMGATKGFLLRDSLGQAVVVLAVSIVAGVLIATGVGLWLESTPMPFSTEVAPILGGALILFIAGLIGALVAVYRVTRTNPLQALGENR